MPSACFVISTVSPLLRPGPLIPGGAVEVSGELLRADHVHKGVGIGLAHLPGELAHLAARYHRIDEHTGGSVVQSHSLHQGGGVVGVLDLDAQDRKSVV